MEANAHDKTAAAKSYTVRPFGVMGSEYAVDAAGLRRHWLGHLLVVLFAALLMFRERLALPGWSVVTIAAALALGVVVLCADVVRKGRRL